MGKWDKLHHDFYQRWINSDFFLNKIVDSLDWNNKDDLSLLGLNREYRT